jgi:hypothetical protein
MLPSCGIQFRVASMWTEVSAERINPIFRVKNPPSKKSECNRWLGRFCLATTDSCGRFRALSDASTRYDLEIPHPFTVYKQKTNSVALVCVRTIPTSDRRLTAKLVPTFADRGCRVISATDPHGRILGFLGWSRYFFQVALQLFLRG